jgi:hypothetical protein
VQVNVPFGGMLFEGQLMLAGATLLSVKLNKVPLLPPISVMTYV